MAILSDPNRTTIWAEFMREISAAGESLGLTKADMRAAVDAADAWADSNAAAYNTALPQPARSALTAVQKARLLAAVIQRRWIAGS